VSFAQQKLTTCQETKIVYFGPWTFHSGLCHF